MNPNRKEEALSVFLQLIFQDYLPYLFGNFALQFSANMVDCRLPEPEEKTYIVKMPGALIKCFKGPTFPVTFIEEKIALNRL